jgi:hypothetical protein
VENAPCARGSMRERRKRERERGQRAGEKEERERERGQRERLSGGGPARNTKTHAQYR